MNAADIGPIAPADRRQSPLDLFVIFACANIVATTFQTGASLVPAFGLGSALTLVAIGGRGRVAADRGAVGGRPASRRAVGHRGPRGARHDAVPASSRCLLYVTNFAWIAVNNVIAASACARIAGGPASERAWAVGLGVVSTLIVAGGPRLVARADRLAVPLLAVVGIVPDGRPACGFRRTCCGRPAPGRVSWPAGLDIVIGYQVSWILMFADYSRYTASRRKARRGGLPRPGAHQPVADAARRDGGARRRQQQIPGRCCRR